MSLYLKYRPQDFNSLVGQAHAKKTIQSAVLSDRLAHAYLFSGPRGTGKTSLARILAKRINCLNPQNNEPCNACEMCQAITQGALVDLIEIDAASNRGIDEIRELREKIRFSPTQARSKVYIIDEVHMLTKEAFNALLKTLEEPPSHAYFVLATTEIHKIPETIISRCQQFTFKRIEIAEISQRLQEIADAEHAEVDSKALDLIAKLSEGGLRDAIGLFEQMMLNGQVTVDAVNEQLGLTGEGHLIRFFHAISENSAVEAVNILTQVISQGKHAEQFIKEWMAYLRKELLTHLEDRAKVAQMTQWIDYFLKAKTQIDLSPIPQLPLEVAILKCCQAPFSSSSEKMLDPSVGHQANVNEDSRPVVTSDQSKISEAPSNSSQLLTLALIKKQWSRVLESIPTPFVKLSLSQGRLTDFKDGVLRIDFDSDAFKKKIESPAHQSEIQNALHTVFAQSIEVHLGLNKVDLPKVEVELDKEPSSNSKSIVEMAADVFGQ